MGSSVKNILFVASEAAPFVKVGGLGEVMRSLPKVLRGLGYDARVMLPKYATIDTKTFPLELEERGIRPISNDDDPHGILTCNVLSYTDKGGNKIAYFLENQEYYEKRANVYGYSDDTVRWVLLSKGALNFLCRSDWKPEVIVASDWQAGFLPNLLHKDYKDYRGLSDIASVFSIHNLYFQGLFDQRFVADMDFDAGQRAIPDFFDPDLVKMNGMRRGIMHADAINTVSPTYAREIMSEEYGEGLHKLIAERKARLFGILNGIDLQTLDPAVDPDVPVHYSIGEVDKKRRNKPELQKRFNLPQDQDMFVIGIVSRMDAQKGFDLIMQAADALIKNINFQLVVLGDGANEFRLFFNDLQKKYPERIGTHLIFDDKLPRLIFAGADAILVPSRFEPSGLVQMEAMRYGAIPIVRRVGGLADSVQDYNPQDSSGTGFVFGDYDPFALTAAVIRAFDAYQYKKEWAKLVKRAMKADFSWEKSAKEYLRLFDFAVKAHQEEKNNTGPTNNYSL